MMRFLACTPPSRGHLTPMVGPLLELRRRGAEVHVRTLAAAVDAVRAAGLEAAPISPAIEAIVLDDHEARSQITAGARPFATLRRSAEHEVPDLEAALDSVAPESSWSTRPRSAPRRRPSVAACAGPSRDPGSSKGRPADGTPLGFGLRPQGPPQGPLRNRALGPLAGHFDSVVRLPAVNAGGRGAGLPPLRSATELATGRR